MHEWFSSLKHTYCVAGKCRFAYITRLFVVYLLVLDSRDLGDTINLKRHHHPESRNGLWFSHSRCFKLTLDDEMDRKFAIIRDSKAVLRSLVLCFLSSLIFLLLTFYSHITRF